MSRKKKPQKPMNKWAGITALLILFFPAGIIYLIVEINRDKEHMRRNGRIIYLIGFVVLLYSCLFKIRNVFDSTLNGRVAFQKSLCSVLCGLLFSSFIIFWGLFFARRGSKDKKLIRLICSDHILGLSELSVLTASSLRFLRVRIDRLLSEKRLPGIEVIRQAEPVSGSENSGAGSTQADPVQGNIKNAAKKIVSGFVSGNGLRNALWITAAFFCCYSYFILLAVWFVIAALAFFLELKNEPRNYRVIFWSAAISMGVDLFMVLTVGFFNVISGPPSEPNMTLFMLFLPGIPAAGLQLLAYSWLSSRKSQSIVGLKESPGSGSVISVN